MNLSPQLVMPGDDVTTVISGLLEDEAKKYVVGPGLFRDGRKTMAVTAGILKMREKPLVFWVNSRQKKVSLCKYFN